MGVRGDSMANSREQQFQQDIIDALAQQGWLTGMLAAYDRRRALHPSQHGLKNGTRVLTLVCIIRLIRHGIRRQHVPTWPTCGSAVPSPTTAANTLRSLQWGALSAA